MAGVNEKISVVVDILGDISNFQNSIKGMQGELNKLHLSNGIKDSFTQIFSELEREIGKIQTIGSKKKIDLIDSKALNKSFANVEALYTRLVNKMQSSGVKNSLFEKDVASINAMRTAMEAYKNSIKHTESQTRGLKGAITKIKNEMQDLVSSKTTGSLKIVSEEDYQEQVKLIADLQAKLNDAHNRGKNKKLTQDERARAIEEELILTEQLKEKTAELESTTTQEKYKAEVQDIADRLKVAKDKLQEFINTNKLQSQTTAWDTLLDKIQKIEGIDWQKIGIDPSTFKSIEDLNDALGKLEGQAAKDAQAAIAQLDNTARGMGGSLEEAGRKAEQTAQSLMDLGDRQRDIQQLASRLTHFFSLTNQFMIMRRIIQNAITTIKELDKAMTETAVVTDFNVADMWAQLPEYTKVANELGATTKGAYETMTLFYQQGLNQQQAFQLGTETMKMARIAGLDYAEATDRMTNALRGFNMELNDVSSQRVNDVYSNLAAKSASNVDELSTAMTKTASIAHAANMEFETTAAFLAQIIETTRESAETAGTALKTVIARFSEVKKLYSEGELTGQDEEGEEINVNRVSTALRAAGVDLNEYLIGAKGLDEVFIELASKWDNLDLITQRYIATMAAGSRQQSRFIALMQDYSRQTELVGYAQNAAGASTEQFNKTLDSLEAKLNKLENAWNEFTMGIANSSLIKGAIDLITGLITAINKITSALGPVGGAITKVLLLFGGFKGIRVLFDKFVGHIAKTYIDIARKAGVAGMGAGEAYSKGFLASATKGFNKIKSVFSPETWVADTSSYSNLTKQIQQLSAAQQQLQNIESSSLPAGTKTMALRTAQNEVLSAQTALFETLGFTEEEEVLVSAAGVTTDEMQAAATNEVAAAKLEEKLITKGCTKEEAKNIIVKIQSQAANAGLLTQLKLVIMALFSQKSAVDAVTVAEEKGIIFTKGFKTAIELLNKQILGMPLGWFIAMIAGAIALISALVMSANELSIDGKLEDAANLAKSLDEELKAVQNTLDEFDEHTSSIETLKDELSELTTGTQEWKNKVQELNNEYIELSKLIGSDFWQNATIENGAINVDDNYLRKAQQDLIDTQTKLQQEQIQTSMMTTDLNLQKSGTSLIKDNNLGKAAQDFFLPYGQQLTEAFNEQFTKSIQNLSSEDIKRLMSAGDMKSFNKITSELLNGYTFDGDDVKAAQADLQNYINDVNNATAQMDASIGLMAQDLKDKTIDVDGYKKVFSDLYQDNLDAIEDIGAEVDKNLFMAPQTIAAHLNAKADELNLNVDHLDNMEEAFDEYIRIMNEAYGEGTYKREGWDIKKLNDEGSYEKIDIGAGEVAQRVLTDWVNNQDFESAYKDKIEEIQTALTEAGLEKEFDDGALQRILGGTFTQEDIRGKGKEVFDTLQNILKDKEYDIEIAPTLVANGEQGFIDDLQNKLSKAGLDIDANVLFGKANLKGQNALTKLFTEQITGNKAEIEKLVMSLSNNTSIEEFSNILDHIANIDIYDKEQWERFPKWLKDAGINIPNTQLEQFVSNMQELAGVFETFNLENSMDDLSALYQILRKVQSGDVQANAIDEETRKTLIDKNVAKETDFYQDYNTGNYVYFEGQDSLEAAISKATEAIDDNTEETLNNRLEANKAVERENDEWLLEDLTGSGTNSQQRAIESFVSTMQQNGISLDSLKIKGLSDTTDIANLTPKQRELISSGIAEVILGGVEQAQAQIDQFNGSMKTTEAANQLEQGNVQGVVENGIDEYDTQAIESYFQALENGDVILNKVKKDLKDQAEAEGKVTAAYISSERQLKAVTIAYNNSLKAIDKLNDGLDDNLDAIKTSKKGTSSYITALGNLAKSASEVFGQELSPEFIESHLPLFEQLAEGGETAQAAFEALGNEIATDYINSLNLAEGETATLVGVLNQLDGLNLEIGGTADFSQIINEAIAAGASVEDLKAVVESAGYSMVAEETGHYYVPDKWQSAPGGNGAIPTHWQRIPTYSVKVTKTGASGSRKGSKGGGSGSGGGGGGGSNEKPEDNRDWKNPYDELYNSYAKLEELQRKRNRLEKEYNLLIDTAGASYKTTNKYLEDQLKNLEDQRKVQNDIIAGKKKQISEIKDKTYEVENGQVKTFASAFADAMKESNKISGTSFSNNLTDYAWYDTNTEQMHIEWDKIDALEGKIDSTTGAILEAYVSELEGLEDQLEEATDALDDIAEETKAIIDNQLQNRIDFVESMREAMINSMQKNIDKLSTLNETINEANSKIFDSIQEQIDLERQIRDNTKKEDDIAKNEARLAYLRRDTSGANDLEIQKLEQTLAEQRESYSDQLVDQELSRLQDQADKAAEQRERQIDIMEKQLAYYEETGYFSKAIDQGLTKTQALDYFKDWKNFDAATEAEKIKILEDFNALWNKGSNKSGTAQLAAADNMYQGQAYTIKDDKGKVVGKNATYDVTTDTWKDEKGNTYKATDIASADILGNTITLKKKEEPKQEPQPNKNGNGASGDSKSTAKKEEAPKETYPHGKASAGSRLLKKKNPLMTGEDVKAVQYALNKLGFTDNSGNKLKVDGQYGDKTKAAVKKFQKAMGISDDGIVGSDTRKEFKAKGYSTGGLADYTGPAWLHGSKSKPEMVLNAKDTENFIQLKDTLADVAKESKNGSSGGDNYFDIKVEVGEIGSDYDVEKMIDKIKDEINQDARYRNVNSINFIR